MSLADKKFKLEPIRHQAAIIGFVKDKQSERALAGAKVEITKSPQDLNLPQQVYSRVDGLCIFLDLPDGQYTLKASCPYSECRYGTDEKIVNVTRKAQGRIVQATIEFKLPPTTIAGEITVIKSGKVEPVVMAEIRILGSGETTYSDAQGKYKLTGIETGRRTVIINAQGFKKSDQQVLLDTPGMEYPLNVVLNV